MPRPAPAGRPKSLSDDTRAAGHATERLRRASQPNEAESRPSPSSRKRARGSPTSPRAPPAPPRLPRARTCLASGQPKKKLKKSWSSRTLTRLGHCYLSRRRRICLAILHDLQCTLPAHQRSRGPGPRALNRGPTPRITSMGPQIWGARMTGRAIGGARPGKTGLADGVSRLGASTRLIPLVLNQGEATTDC